MLNNINDNTQHVMKDKLFEKLDTVDGILKNKDVSYVEVNMTVENLMAEGLKEKHKQNILD